MSCFGHNLTLAVEKGQDDVLRLCKNIVATLDLEMRYSDPNISQLLAIASFLHPRFKLRYVGTERVF